jgi:uncharacterized protein DUF1242
VQYLRAGVDRHRSSIPPRRRSVREESVVYSKRFLTSSRVVASASHPSSFFNTPWSVFFHVLFFLTRLMTSLCTDTLSQSALFNFQSLLLVILLLICTCTYVRAVAPRLIDSNKQGYVFFRFIAMRLCLSLTLPRMTRTASGKFFGFMVPTRLSYQCFPVLTAYLYCTRFLGIFFMFARIGELRHSSHTPQLGADRPNPMFAPCAGERLSPYVALASIAMAVRMILS